MNLLKVCMYDLYVSCRKSYWHITINGFAIYWQSTNNGFALLAQHQ